MNHPIIQNMLKLSVITIIALSLLCFFTTKVPPNDNNIYVNHRTGEVLAPGIYARFYKLDVYPRLMTQEFTVMNRQMTTFGCELKLSLIPGLIPVDTAWVKTYFQREVRDLIASDSLRNVVEKVMKISHDGYQVKEIKFYSKTQNIFEILQ